LRLGLGTEAASIEEEAIALMRTDGGGVMMTEAERQMRRGLSALLLEAPVAVVRDLSALVYAREDELKLALEREVMSMKQVADAAEAAVRAARIAYGFSANAYSHGALLAAVHTRDTAKGVAEQAERDGSAASSGLVP
jgi:hypothetical protein